MTGCPEVNLRRNTRLTLAGLAAGLGQAPALAHSPIEGMNSFYAGVLHPAVVPAHAAALLALGLLLGQGGGAVARSGALACLVALALGLLALGAGLGWSAEPVLLAAALVLGVAVATQWRPPPRLLTAVAAALGLVLALDSDPGQVQALARLLALLGTGLGATLLLATGLWLADAAGRRPAPALAVRVLGSWIAASALMVSALSFAPPRPPAASTAAVATPDAGSWPMMPTSLPC